MNGAAYGPGIYISPHAQTVRVINIKGDDNRALDTAEFTTVVPIRKMVLEIDSWIPIISIVLQFVKVNCFNVLCNVPVIDHDIKKHGTVWVQPTEDFVVTRFFFVYTGSDVGSATQCSTEVSTFVEEIKRAIKAHSLNE